MTNFICHSLFGCHIAVSNVAPGFCMRDVSGVLTLASCHLCLFMGAGIVRVHFGAFIVIWAGVFFVCGWLWVVVGGLASFQCPSAYTTYVVWALACLLFWVNHGMWEACSMSAKGERTSMSWAHSPIRQCP